MLIVTIFDLYKLKVYTYYVVGKVRLQNVEIGRSKRETYHPARLRRPPRPSLHLGHTLIKEGILATPSVSHW